MQKISILYVFSPKTYEIVKICRSLLQIFVTDCQFSVASQTFCNLQRVSLAKLHQCQRICIIHMQEISILYVFLQKRIKLQKFAGLYCKFSSLTAKSPLPVRHFCNLQRVSLAKLHDVSSILHSSHAKKSQSCTSLRSFFLLFLTGLWQVELRP